jgi:hypothetical protein
MTIASSRLNKRRCEMCGHPKREGKPCRRTGLKMTECEPDHVHVLRMDATRRALRPRKDEIR